MFSNDIEKHINIYCKQYLEFEIERINKSKPLLQEFLNYFSINKLKTISLEEYALGHENFKDSFCYWLETFLNDYGNIHGATSLKFGVYFGKWGKDKENKWHWTKWANEDFDNIRSELNLLISAGQVNDIELIEKNRISPMFKGKILAVYFPDKYLNVFSYEHIKYFLKCFGEAE